MEYTVTTNKDELDIIENGYFEFCPGLFNKNFWNDNSLFISDDLMDYIEGILEKSNSDFSGFNDWTYFSKNEVNIFENELLNLTKEISNDDVSNIHYEYLQKEIIENKIIIIEMLNKIYHWIELNKKDGISIAKKFWDFKVLTIRDLPEPCGGYLEFLPGKFNDKYWNENSVFIEEGELDIVDHLLWKVNNKYDRYGCDYYYDEDLVNKLIDELQNRLEDLISNGYIISKSVCSQRYFDYINERMDLYKEEIIKMLEDLISWVKMNKSNGITVIGM